MKNLFQYFRPTLGEKLSFCDLVQNERKLWKTKRCEGVGLRREKNPEFGPINFSRNSLIWEYRRTVRHNLILSLCLCLLPSNFQAQIRSDVHCDVWLHEIAGSFQMASPLFGLARVLYRSASCLGELRSFQARQFAPSGWVNLYFGRQLHLPTSRREMITNPKLPRIAGVEGWERKKNKVRGEL